MKIYFLFWKGVFGYGFNCTLSNINFDNVTITSNSPTTEYMGLIGYSLCEFDKVKIKNSKFNINFNQANNLLLGGMCGYCSTYKMMDSESTNNTFNINVNTTNNRAVAIGGIGGPFFFNFFFPQINNFQIPKNRWNYSHQCHLLCVKK